MVGFLFCHPENPINPRIMADRTGLEPATSGVTGRHSNQLNYRSAKCYFYTGGWYRGRTCDLRLVRPSLYQLS